MRKYQIYELNKELNHAGSKAPEDVSKISSEMGFEKIIISKSNNKQDIFSKIKRQIIFSSGWNKAYSQIKPNSIVLLQHPFRDRQINRERILLKLKKKKAVKFICVIHDVEKLRGTMFNEYYKNEFDFMLKIADKFIVHNRNMEKYFISLGVDKNKLINLHIFDYLQSNSKVGKKPIFTKDINIAGNLDASKSKYLAKLGKINANFILYGPNFNLKHIDNVKYMGSFPADDIPNKLVKGFGLIWDGNSVDTCDGATGKYLQYNNPHKLSLYLSSGLPVIIWKNAAEAQFVSENNLGLVVKSLKQASNQLKKISKKQYDDYSRNVQMISKKLLQGKYLKKALDEAVSSLENE